jgi:hypothetical protein
MQKQACNIIPHYSLLRQQLGITRYSPTTNNKKLTKEDYMLLVHHREFQKCYIMNNLARVFHTLDTKTVVELEPYDHVMFKTTCIVNYTMLVFSHFTLFFLTIQGERNERTLKCLLLTLAIIPWSTN